MRKQLLIAIFSLFAIPFTTFAQTEKPNRMTLHYKSGETQEFDLTNLDYVEFDHVTQTDTPSDSSEVILPKVGDYFYSDGTWSDGGLISIDANGCNAVWSETKPAPIDGKTVIGIVFNTNPDRIAEADKEDGYTHGYVIGCKFIRDPQKSNYDQWPETVWYADENYAKITSISSSRNINTCYNNINGREETTSILAANDPKYYSSDIPLFYYGTSEYPVAAPEGTSGWFIPSVGQMWDCVANFCSGEVATFLAGQTESTDDFTYYCTQQCETDIPFEKFSAIFSLVPDADKDVVMIPDGSKGNYVSLATSSRYASDSRVIFNLGTNGCTLIEGMAGWLDEEVHSFPILAF